MILKNIFDGLGTNEFDDLFDSDERCLEFLSSAKWENGYICRKCGNSNYCDGPTPYSRRCTRCKHTESAMANTPFHGCRMPLHRAFKMAWQICCNPEVSSYELSRQNDTRQMTCWKLKSKLNAYLHSNTH